MTPSELREHQARMAKKRELEAERRKAEADERRELEARAAMSDPAWHRWCEAKIARALAAQPLFFEAQADVIAETISLLRAELRREFVEQLAELRADLAVQTGIARGEIKQLRGKADAA